MCEYKKTGVWFNSLNSFCMYVCVCVLVTFQLVALNKYCSTCGLLYRHISKLSKQSWTILFDTLIFSLNVLSYSAYTPHTSLHFRLISLSACAQVEEFNSITVFLLNSKLDTKVVQQSGAKSCCFFSFAVNIYQNENSIRLICLFHSISSDFDLLRGI